MSEQTVKNNTFYTLTKWFKWFSVILILVPLAWIVINILFCFDRIPTDAMTQAGTILQIITMVAAAIWVILDVILIFAAGNVRAYMSPLNLRVWLIVAFILVFAPVLFDALVFFDVFGHVGIDFTEPTMRIVRACLPAAVVLGLLLSVRMGTKIKRKLLG